MNPAGQTYDTLAGLQVCCRAGVVGLTVAPVAGSTGGEATLARAVRLGQARRLTDIPRDVGQDFRAGRVDLPGEARRRHGADVGTLARGGLTPEDRALTAELATRAQARYDEAEPGLTALHPRARPAVTAARPCRAILDELERQGDDNLNRRAVVPGRSKPVVTAGALWRSPRLLSPSPPGTGRTAP